MVKQLNVYYLRNLDNHKISLVDIKLKLLGNLNFTAEKKFFSSFDIFFGINMNEALEGAYGAYALTTNARIGAFSLEDLAEICYKIFRRIEEPERLNQTSTTLFVD